MCRSQQDELVRVGVWVVFTIRLVSLSFFIALFSERVCVHE